MAKPVELTRGRLGLLLASLFLPLCTISSFAQAPGRVRSLRKVTENQSGFDLPLAVNDQLGRSVARLGDLNRDGIEDIAVGAQGDDSGGSNQGAFYVLFLDIDGRVKSSQKISSVHGGFSGNVQNGSQFGRALCAIGDVDGDSVVDIAVGANLDDDGGEGQGAVWILFMRTDGTVKGYQKISAQAGGFTGRLDVRDEFGRSVAPVGDLNGDGTPDIAVGASYDDDGGMNRGAIYVIFLKPDGRVLQHQKISSLAGGLNGPLRNLDYFAHGLGSIGDFDGDGRQDLISGAVLDDDGGLNRGAAWLLFLNADGTVKSERKISDTQGGFTGVLGDRDQFGVSVAGIGDIDGNGVTDVAIGAVKDDDGGGGRGALWICFLNSAGHVIGHQKISSTMGGFTAPLDNFDWFGSAVAPLGDLNLDGVPDISIGSRYDDDGGFEAGAIYNVFLQGSGPIRAHIEPYGGTTNPQQSFVILGNAPTVGAALLFGVDNPVGSQPPGSLPVVVFSDRPASVLVPGLGMSGALGEVLVDGARVHTFVIGRAWKGPGRPTPIGVVVPNDPALVGAVVFAQGLMLDIRPEAKLPVALAGAAYIRVGF